MPDRISRRTVLAAIPAAALAQTPPHAGQAPAGAAAQPPAAAAVKNPADKLQQANADVKQTGDQLRQISVPMDLEPALTFHV